MGAYPRCSRTTAPRYSAPNNVEMMTIRARAPAESEDAANDRVVRIIAADVKPAKTEAMTNLQTEATTGVILNPIGLPAYQNAGIVRIQNDAVQATAIPSGPHASPSRNSSPVTVNSTATQRNQRFAVPMERWIHPIVP